MLRRKNLFSDSQKPLQSHANFRAGQVHFRPDLHAAFWRSPTFVGHLVWPAQPSGPVPEWNTGPGGLVGFETRPGGPVESADVDVHLFDTVLIG